MKILVPVVLAAAAMAAACDRAPTTKSEYNNSGASATPAQPAAIAAPGSPTSADSAPKVAIATSSMDMSSSSSSAVSVVSDSLITGKVKAAIAADSGMKDSNVSVTTNQGVVTLSGSVKSPDQMTIASNLAIRQQGVQKVETNVVVK